MNNGSLLFKKEVKTIPIEKAIKWMEFVKSKKIRWDNYDYDTAAIRFLCEQEIEIAYDMAIEALRAQLKSQ